MKPITGSVVSSKPVSLSKAATILSRFAASDTGANQDISAFLRRTSEAFDELVRFHKELRAQRAEHGSKDGEQDERRKKGKKKKEVVVVEAVQDGNFAEIEGKRKKKEAVVELAQGGNIDEIDSKKKEEAAVVEAAQYANVAEIEGKRKKKKKKKEEAGIEAAQDGSLAETGGDPGTSARRHGGGDIDVGESKSDSREKKRSAREIEGRLGNVAVMGSDKNNKAEVKKTKNEYAKEGREGEGDVENHSERQRKEKRKKEEDVKEESGGGLENHEERHHKKKRKVKEES